MADEQKTESNTEVNTSTDGDAGVSNANAGSNTDNGTAKPEVEFSADQQKKVQELIDASYKKAFEKAADKGASGNGDEVAKLKADLAKATDAANKKTAPDVDEMKKKIATLEATNDGLEANKVQTDALRKKELLLTAISKHSVRSIGDVAQLIENAITVGEDGLLQIHGEGGAPKVNAKGDDMTIDEFISTWLAERPHFLNAAGGTGAGSGSAMFGEGKEQIRLMTPEDVQNMDIDKLKEVIGNGLTIKGARNQDMNFQKVENPFREAKKRKAAAGR